MLYLLYGLSCVWQRHTLDSAVAMYGGCELGPVGSGAKPEPPVGTGQISNWGTLQVSIR